MKPMPRYLPILLCFRCGFRQGDRYSEEAKAHRRRCDYTQTIRYLNLSTGSITDGNRPRGGD